MNIDKKMQQVEQETVALMRYIDSRDLKADIGLSTLVSALVSVTSALELPIEVIAQAIIHAREEQDEYRGNRGKSLH